MEKKCKEKWNFYIKYFDKIKCYLVFSELKHTYIFFWPKYAKYAEKQSEPPHDNTNKMACVPSEASDQPDQSLRCLHEESLGP